MSVRRTWNLLNWRIFFFLFFNINFGSKIFFLYNIIKILSILYLGTYLSCKSEVFRIERCSSNLNILDAFQQLSHEWIKLTWHSRSMNQKLRGIMFHRERTISFTFRHLPFDRHSVPPVSFLLFPVALREFPMWLTIAIPVPTKIKRKQKKEEEERKRNG